MYQLTQQQMTLKNEIRKFVNENLIPIAKELETSHKFPSEIIKRCGELGYLNTSFTPTPSITSGGAIETAILIEELSRGLGSLGLILAPHFQGISLLSIYGSSELKSKYLTSALHGQSIFAYAITEENSGTNVLDISATATKDVNDWILNGKKCWVTNAGIADGYFICVQTALASKRRSLSFFFVEKNTPGLSFAKNETMTGCASSVMGTLELNNCRIPSTHLIGTENDAYGFMKSSLNLGRLAASAASIGIAHRALELAINYSTSREFYGRKLYSHQGISFPIAEMYTQIAACKNMLYHTAALCESNQSISTDVAALKLLANETCIQVCRKSQEIHGAYGLSKEAEIERCLRDAQMLTTAEGTLSACKMSVSSSLLKSSLDQYF